MFKPFNLKSPISSAVASRAEDVLKTKYALANLEYFKEPSYGLTEWPDDEMFRAIRSFQSDNRLKPDGMILLDGYTEGTINRKLLMGPWEPLAKIRQDHENICEYRHEIHPAIGSIWPFPLPGKRRGGACPVDDKCDRQLDDDLEECTRVAKGNK